MPGNEEQIRHLIERWADAVHRGDRAGVLADHATPVQRLSMSVLSTMPTTERCSS